MFSPSYAWHELTRRFGRTLVTAIGLAAGVGLVMSIIGVSDGLSAAQNSVLSPLGSVGTNIIVTRTVAATTNKNASSTSKTNGSGTTRRGGGGFFAQGFAGASAATLNSAASSTLLENNSSVLTDLAKLGPAGTKFTHDFFLPGTLIDFPDQAAGIISKIKDVSSVTGALSLDAIHETGTVPTITATYKTGGQTLKVTSKPPTLTAAQEAAERSCIEKLFASSSSTRPTNSGSGGATGRPTFGSGGATGRPAGGGGIRFIGTNSAFSKCETAQQRAYEQNVVVPEETIRETLNPPTTNTQTASYTVAGVDPAASTGGLITKAQVTKGTWFTASEADEVLVNQGYATQKGLHAGETMTINSKDYKIVGLVNPTLTGDVADVYFDLSTAQSLASAPKEINEVLVSVKNAGDVNAVAAAIQKDLPGATVLTSKTLADTVKGSLSNAKKVANTFGTALAIVVLLAAFLIAALLTLSSVAKRVREIGTLRAIGWSRGAVVRQIVAETIGIGVVGAVLGIGLGIVIAAVISAIGPGLSVTSSGLAVGASSLSASIGQSTNASVTSIIHLSAPIHATTVLLGLASAIVGGLLAGIAGGWRASRLAPAVALRDLG
ncbi:MAG: FtsX-like permease family protein [Acidimicrobiales bacterium]